MPGLSASPTYVDPPAQPRRQQKAARTTLRFVASFPLFAGGAHPPPQGAPPKTKAAKKKNSDPRQSALHLSGMFATLKHNVEDEKLSRKPPLGEKRPTLRLVWENPALSAGTHKEESTVKPDASYGRVLYNYFRDYDPRLGRYMSSDPIGLNGGLNTYTYVKNKPVLDTDPAGLGPYAFLTCTAANAAYNVYSFASTLEELDSTALLRDQLQRVNKQISECPAEDTERLAALTEIRGQLVNALTESVGQIAQSNNRFGFGDVAQAAAIEGVCGLLLLAPGL